LTQFKESFNKEEIVLLFSISIPLDKFKKVTVDGSFGAIESMSHLIYCAGITRMIKSIFDNISS
jgi:hypothetical protein